MPESKSQALPLLFVNSCGRLLALTPHYRYRTLPCEQQEKHPLFPNKRLLAWLVSLSKQTVIYFSPFAGDNEVCELLSGPCVCERGFKKVNAVTPKPCCRDGEAKSVGGREASTGVEFRVRVKGERAQ